MIAVLRSYDAESAGVYLPSTDSKCQLATHWQTHMFLKHVIEKAWLRFFSLHFSQNLLKLQSMNQSYFFLDARLDTIVPSSF